MPTFTTASRYSVAMIYPDPYQDMSPSATWKDKWILSMDEPGGQRYCDEAATANSMRNVMLFTPYGWHFDGFIESCTHHDLVIGCIGNAVGGCSGALFVSAAGR